VVVDRSCVTFFLVPTTWSYIKQITMVGEDYWLESNEMWIEWTELEDGESLKYHSKVFTKPKGEEQLIKKINMIQNNNDKSKAKETQNWC
jgi:hypothetical protein